MSDPDRPADLPQSPAPPAAAPPCYPDPIPGVIPFGSIFSFTGTSNTGKSHLLAQMLVALRDGQPIFGHMPNPPTAIGLLSGDRSWASNHVPFEKAGYGDIHVRSLADVDGFNWMNLLDKIGAIPEHFARELDTLALPPGGLVVVDPVALWLPASMNYKQTAVGMTLLRQITRPRQLTMGMMFHTHKIAADTKDRVLRPQDRILGSGAQTAYSDTVMYLVTPEELSKPYYEFGWIPHNAPSETFKLTKDEHGLFCPYVGLDDVGLGDGGVVRDEEGNPEDIIRLTSLGQLELMIIRAGRDGLTTPNACARAIDELKISKPTFYRHLTRLKNDGRIFIDEYGVIRAKVFKA